MLLCTAGYPLGATHRLIFCPIFMLKARYPLYPAYVRRFNIVTEPCILRGQQIGPHPITGIYILRRARGSDGSLMGAVVPLYQSHKPIDFSDVQHHFAPSKRRKPLLVPTSDSNGRCSQHPVHGKTGKVPSNTVDIRLGIRLQIP